MRFADEYWIRLYTRDTTTWLSWPWQAQGLFMAILRKVDRAGLIELNGLPIGVAVRITTNWPHEVVDKYLPILMTPVGKSEASIRQHEDFLVIPRFQEAQRARSSSTARTRDQRERERANARAAALGISSGSDHADSGAHIDENGEATYQNRRSETQRPSERRSVPDGDAASQFETESIERRERRDVRVKDSVETESGAGARAASGSASRTAAPSNFVSLVLERLDQARARLSKDLDPTKRGRASERMVRQPMRNCDASVEDWYLAIEGQYLDLKNKPAAKHKFLCLSTLAKDDNFLRALENGKREAKRRKRSQAVVQERVVDTSAADAERKRLEAIEEAEAEAAIQNLKLPERSRSKRKGRASDSAPANPFVGPKDDA